MGNIFIFCKYFKNSNVKTYNFFTSIVFPVKYLKLYTLSQKKISSLSKIFQKNNRIFKVCPIFLPKIWRFLMIYRKETGRLSIADRGRIVDLCRALQPKWTLIAREMRKKFRLTVTARTCKRTWERWGRTRSVRDRRHTGRPRKCTARDEKYICAFARRHRFSSLKDIAKYALDHRQLSLSTDSVSRALKKHGLFRRVAIRKPLLTQRALQKRVEWARVHANWAMEKWRRVVFSDEKIFRTENNRRSLLVTRSRGEKYKRECIQHTLKGGIQVHVWGAIGWNGCAPLKRVDGNLNAQKYQQNIINDLRDVGQNIASRGRNFIFQQDMAPAHNAGTTHTFLVNQGIQEMDWPGNSPDMNIIENLWATMARKVGEHATRPRNSEELWERIQNAWSTISIAELRKLYRSIPSRIESVLNAQGGSTKY